MTPAQWKDKSYRTFKNRTAFITYNIHGDNQCVVDLSQVESVEYPTIQYSKIYPGSSVKCSEIKLFARCTMKSGNVILVTKSFPVMYNEVQKTGWFGKVKTIKVPFKHQDYFDFMKTHPLNEMSYFHDHLKELREAFVNNVCIIRN